MDNRKIEEIRENETKLIDEIKQLEKENQELKNQQKKFIEWLEYELGTSYPNSSRYYCFQ